MIATTAAETGGTTPRSTLGPRGITLLLCAAELASMSGFSTYPALLDLLRREWRMSATEAGLVGGIFSAGYMLAVPLLSALTDRRDARLVYVGAALLSAAACVAFGAFARGLGTALLLEALIGAGLAGTYMPGLKLLIDSVESPRKSRYIALYTATFGFGASGSLFLAGWLVPILGWRWTFAVSGAGPLLAAVLVMRLPADRRPREPTAGRAPLREALRNRMAVLYIAGYAAHCWELFGLRGWFVAFLGFAGEIQGRPVAQPAMLVGLLSLLGPVASVLGNEAASRIGHLRWIRGTMIASTVLALAVGAGLRLPFGVLLAAAAIYFLVVMADSASLTAGLVEASAATHRGTMIGIYSLAGFGAGFAAPLAFGLALDSAGGDDEPGAWGVAFGTLAAASALWLALARVLGARRDR